MNLNCNDFSVELTTVKPTVTIPFLNSPGTIQAVTPTSQFYYPCTIWVNPITGSSVAVTTSFDQVDQVPWSNGTVTTAATGALLSCPGTITFNLVSGTSAKVGVT